MASVSTLEQIAKEILQIESNIQGNADSEAVKLAEERINELIKKNNLRLEDMIQIDAAINGGNSGGNSGGNTQTKKQQTTSKWKASDHEKDKDIYLEKALEFARCFFERIKKS